MSTTFDTVRTGAPPAARRSFGQFAHDIFAEIRRQMRIARDRRALNELPDYMLDDIGITRSEIDSVVRFGRYGRRLV